MKTERAALPFINMHALEALDQALTNLLEPLNLKIYTLSPKIAKEDHLARLVDLQAAAVLRLPAELVHPHLPALVANRQQARRRTQLLRDASRLSGLRAT